MALLNMRKTRKIKAIGHIRRLMSTYGAEAKNKYRIRILGDFPPDEDEYYITSGGKIKWKKKNMTEKLEHKGLPVEGYKPNQPKENVDLVNEGKRIEERVLRYIEKVEAYNQERSGGDPRMSAVGRTQIQLGFMAVFRSVFTPQRINLPEDF